MHITMIKRVFSDLDFVCTSSLKQTELHLKKRIQINMFLYGLHAKNKQFPMFGLFVFLFMEALNRTQ